MNEEQLAYVRAALEQGKTREDITAVLSEHGYTLEQIEALFSAVAAGASVPPPPVTVQSGVAVVALPSMGDLLRSAFDTVIKRFDLVLMVGLVSLVLSALSETWVKYEEDPTVLLLVLFVLVGALGANFIATFATLRNLLSPQESLMDSVRWSRDNFFSLFWVATLVMLVFFASLPLLIPFIALAYYLFFAQVVRIKEGFRGINALVRSTVLVRGNWWGIFWRLWVCLVVLMVILVPVLIVLSLISVPFADVTESASSSVVIVLLASALASIPSAVLSGVGAVLVSSLLVELYRPLAAAKPVFEPAKHPRLRLLYIVLSVIGLLISVLLFIGIVAAVVVSEVAGTVTTSEVL